MADTSVGQNNAKIAFRGRPVREKPRGSALMPYKSLAQEGWAHTPEGEEALGGPAKVAEWDTATKGKKLPERVGKKMGKLRRRGLVSDKAHAIAVAKHGTGGDDLDAATR